MEYSSHLYLANKEIGEERKFGIRQLYRSSSILDLIFQISDRNVSKVPASFPTLLHPCRVVSTFSPIRLSVSFESRSRSSHFIDGPPLLPPPYYEVRGKVMLTHLLASEKSKFNFMLRRH